MGAAAGVGGGLWVLMSRSTAPAWKVLGFGMREMKREGGVYFG